MDIKEIKSLKKISGDVLLFLYFLQRRYGYCDDGILSFDRKMQIEEQLKNSKLGSKIIELTENSIPDAFGAIKYLEEKGFISFNESIDNMTYHFINIRVTAYGIDIIEGIERGEEEKKEFHINFNIKLAENINIDSLIKGEINSLLKLSLI
jgi:hypothetical protein